MKKITLLVVSILLLLAACEHVESSPTKAPPQATVAQEDAQQPQLTPAPVTAVQEPDTASVTPQKQPTEEKAPQTETIQQAVQTVEPVKEPTPSADIPSETVHAKTGYVDPEPTPESEPAPAPTAKADRQAAIDAVNAYAVTQYGVVTDSGLSLDNSAYRFPAAVPVDASQATLEAKARDMVDFTFRQLMMQAGTEAVGAAGQTAGAALGQRLAGNQ